MKRQCSILLTLVLLGSLWADSRAQQAPPWDVTAYQEYFEKHSDLTAAGLMAEYAAGSFTQTAPADLSATRYGPDIHTVFGLTTDEIELIQKHGFAVSERISYPSFGRALMEVFVNDLPVYVSSDAILHALHMSYDDILKDVELNVIIPSVNSMLAELHAALPVLASQYSSIAELDPMFRDLDLYLTIPRKLLAHPVTPVYTENAQPVANLLDMIEAVQPASVALFAETPRTIDFSQFVPRGHYTDDPELEKYFRAMMWLGRTEFYLIAPSNTIPAPTEADVQRQTILTALLSKLVAVAGANSEVENIDHILRTMVGESDNVTLQNVRPLFQDLGIEEPTQLLDQSVFEEFQDYLEDQPFAFQRILSQILIRDPAAGEQIESASSFLLLGQRFTIDSYVLGSVVFDKIEYQGLPVLRMLPSTLDILFALGNNGAAQFLEEELDRYHYAPYLASLRHLIDSYDESFWSSSMYNGWLNAIRQLSPPENREELPDFMQTAGWWQKEMNTQLASWAQLRHDNLLYAKPSYTGGLACSFPESFVEPIPVFFEAVRAFAANAAIQMSVVLPANNEQQQRFRSRIVEYFQNLATTMAKLASIAQKQLDGIDFSDADRLFLGDMLVEMQAYAFEYLVGWYPKLYYNEHNEYSGEDYFSGSIFKEDLVVADVHTQPTDESGNMVGKVLHAGTGPVNMAVLVATNPDGIETTFVGPVMSYYEHVTLNFKRLTDEEWLDMYAEAPSFRPEFSRLYMADRNGHSNPGGLSLSTAVEPDPQDQSIPEQASLVQNYPNPFHESTLIRFTIPRGLSGSSPVKLVVFNATGQLVSTLVEEPLAPGNYTTRWDGSLAGGGEAPSGTYSYVLTIGDRHTAGLMTRIR